MSTEPGPAGRGREGRYSRRRQVLGQLHATVLSTTTPVAVREISIGGFSIETIALFEPESLHRFEFRLDGEPTVTAVATCIHAEPCDHVGPIPIYLTGFEFLPVSETASQAVAALVDRIAELCDEA